MTRKQLRLLFLAIGAIFIVLTAASYPDQSLATMFFIADMVLWLIFFTVWFATRPENTDSGSVPEEREPRDATTGRLD